MPIFEYICSDCGTKSSHLLGMVVDSTKPKCPKCGSEALNKLVSRFVRGRNEDQRIDEVADKLEGMGEAGTYGEMRGLMREMGKAMDEDVSDEMEAMYEDDISGSESP